MVRLTACALLAFVLSAQSVKQEKPLEPGDIAVYAKAAIAFIDADRTRLQLREMDQIPGARLLEAEKRMQTADREYIQMLTALRKKYEMGPNCLPAYMTWAWVCQEVPQPAPAKPEPAKETAKK